LTGTTVLVAERLLSDRLCRVLAEAFRLPQRKKAARRRLLVSTI